MRPKKLTLCAWGPYREKQEINFDAFAAKGIFLITGATGAGKTTLFDAITYALYGALSGEERDKERGSVRSDFADPSTPTYVELVMEHGGKEYRIWRNPEYLRPKKRAGKNAAPLTRERENAVLYFPDGRVLEGSREVNAALQELLVLDYQQFKKISMIAQGEFARLLTAPPKEKTRIFREIFGTGVYEKFTANLGVRSRKLYAKVMEQKHKLEEDIRLLTVGLENSVWDEETRQKIASLVATEYWNYEEVENLLAGMQEDAGKEMASAKAEYVRADREVEKLAGQIAEEEEALRKQLQLQTLLEEKQQLKDKETEIKDKEKLVNGAINAGFVESALQLRELHEKRLVTTGTAIERINAQKETLLEEAEELGAVMEHADRLREVLEWAKQLEECRENQEVLKKQLHEKEGALRTGQEAYLKQQEICSILKHRIEEEEQRRKLSAIGLAATLLEEGKPCPVCGSVNHPAPAKALENLVSEEELQRLRQKSQKEEKLLQRLHEEAVTIKTLRDNLVLQREELGRASERLGTKIAEEEEEICKAYLTLPVKEAMEMLTVKCERAGTVKELLREKQKQLEELEVQKGEDEKALQKAEEKYWETLKQYGFRKEEEYLAARLERDVCEKMQQELEAYQKRVVANQELVRHLKTEVGRKKSVDIEALRSKLTEVKGRKDESLRLLKNWERSRGEVKKTRGLMKDKLLEIEKASAEYGYVKDLENMASGNNSRRLVFEQYVLAGYFEEILRAANLRFQKMTAGRYEMSRVGEVGDGRVKDNLEIQVMDYYTGKYRSVRTLSGGESFKASLALALGMSDVIQSMSGGIRVDTLFVDEGFGALDEESLDQACNTLMNLVEKDCLIGIISHVPELRERIEGQLVIEKTSSGSFVRSSVK